MQWGWDRSAGTDQKRPGQSAVSEVHHVRVGTYSRGRRVGRLARRSSPPLLARCGRRKERLAVSVGDVELKREIERETKENQNSEQRCEGDQHSDIATNEGETSHPTNVDTRW